MMNAMIPHSFNLSRKVQQVMNRDKLSLHLHKKMCMAIAGYTFDLQRTDQW